MIRTTLYSDTAVRKLVSRKGPFSVYEYERDISVDTPGEALAAWYASKMNIRKRQAVCDVGSCRGGVSIQAGAMAMMLGELDVSTGVRGAGDFVGKLIGSRVTGESAVKPLYRGTGQLVLEPSYKHLLIEDVSEWGGSIVLEDGLFLAAEGSLEQKVTRRTNLSSAVAGGEGLFSLTLRGEGLAVLESPAPAGELIRIQLENDTVKIDGSYALAWSESLDFSVQKAGKSIAGSVAGGEGLVNVYSGTGRLLVAPVI